MFSLCHLVSLSHVVVCMFLFFYHCLAAQELETIKKQYVKIADAYGCLGVLQVNAGESSVLYLVLVTGCFSMGKICESEVFRITQTQFVPLQFQAPGEDKIAEVCCIQFDFSLMSFKFRVVFTSN